MRKLVEGRTSKQAPANRTLYYDTEVVYTKFVQGAKPTNTSDFDKAMTWYKNGNDVTISFRSLGFQLHRNTSHMTDTGTEKAYKTINKKSNPITGKDLEHIAKLNHSERMVCTF